MPFFKYHLAFIIFSTLVRPPPPGGQTYEPACRKAPSGRLWTWDRFASWHICRGSLIDEGAKEEMLKQTWGEELLAKCAKIWQRRDIKPWCEELLSAHIEGDPVPSICASHPQSCPLLSEIIWTFHRCNIWHLVWRNESLVILTKRDQCAFQATHE